MALLATQKIALAGLEAVFSAATGGGDTFTPGDQTFLEINNASGGDITVTIDSETPSNFGTDEDVVVVVTAGERRHIGPLPASRFADATTGLGGITYSGVTTLTIAVISL